MRLRWMGIVVAAVLAVSACSGKSVKDTSGSGGGGGTPTTTATNAKCTGVTLTSPDTGVTPTSINITVMADTGSPIRPGLFQGSIDAIKAWAAYVNDNGGLACRKVTVTAWDSKLTQQDSKQGAQNACSNSLALVGTTALFFKDINVIDDCKGKAGTTGLPDVAELQTEATQQCSPNSFAVLPGSGSCPYSGTGPRTFTVGQAENDYLIKNFGPNLHGIWVVPTDLNSTIAASTPLIASSEQAGIKIDKEFGVSGLATQTAYTPVAAAMKQYQATYARNGLDYKGTVLMRKEAQAQGVNTVKAWDCSVQCYDKRLISEGGSAVEGQWVWLNILPLEDKSTNQQLQNMFTYEQKAGKTPDGFGETAWLDGLLFQQAVQSIVDTQGPNAVTRANLLAAIKNIHDFTGGGLAPGIDVGNKKSSPCVIGLQVKNGQFVRVDPAQPGQFDCDNNKTATVTLDPLAAFKG